MIAVNWDFLKTVDGLRLLGAIAILSVSMLSWGWGIKAILTRKAQVGQPFGFGQKFGQTKPVEDRRALRAGIGQILIGLGLALGLITLGGILRDDHSIDFS